MKTEKHPYFASEEDFYAYLTPNADLSREVTGMHAFWKQRLLDCMTGKKTLPFTYDPFFKIVFNPDTHPERLSSFLSAILGRDVEVVTAIPVEHVLHDGKSVIIMDILVRLDDGSRANVEIQKYASGFPDQRISCYSADALMQEYHAAKKKSQSKSFDYRDVNKVYTIILYETSKSPYTDPEFADTYIHRGKVTFDSGIQLTLLQEFAIINLDIFKNHAYTKSREVNSLNGWLKFLTTENVSDIDTVIRDYPWLADIYKETANYLHKPEEVCNMFSKILKEMDENSMLLFVDEVKRERDIAFKERDDAFQQRDDAFKQLDDAKKRLEEMEARLNTLEKQSKTDAF
ncbi:MAG: hypothetical protein E7277_00235 [Lachnospiraceae bacterium]|nr:hypothetical protein [Lachnospiraceae bacterium]